MTELLEDFISHFQGQKRELAELWLNTCCNCDKKTFKDIEKFTTEFIMQHDSSQHAIDIIMNEICEARKAKGLI